MALSYLSQGRPRFDLIDEDVCPDRDVLLFDPRTDLEMAPIGNAARRSITDESAEIVIIRGSSADFDELLERDAVLPTLRPNTPVFGLSPEPGKEQGPRLWQPGWSVPAEVAGPTEAELRSLELRALLNGSGAIFREREFHYALPSRFHAREFVRLGEALCDAVDTVRMVDWILPYLTPDSSVVGDTGSMLALLFALRAEALRRFGWDIPIDTLSEYPVDYEETAATIEEMQAFRPGHMLLLISVSSSGKVAERFETLGPSDRDVLVVCDTAEKPQDREALTRYPIERWEVKGNGECDQCDNLHQLVIDERSYEVRPDVKIKEEPFDRDFAVQQQPFWKLADRTGAVSLHYDREVPGDPNPQTRHMAVHLDIAALLEDKEFRGRVKEKLAGLNFDRVLIPHHRASSGLQELIFEAHPGLDSGNVEVIEGVTIPDPFATSMAPGDRVLILDDALVSGKTLISLRRDIYRKARARQIEVRVDAFVVLSRPRSSSVTASVRRTFGMPGGGGGVEQRFSYVEQVLLPRECTWCDEQRRLKRLLPLLKDEDGLVKRRIDGLELRAGLRAPFLLAGEAPPTELSLGSFFGELSPLAGFAAAASAGQQTRVHLEELRQGGRIAILNVPLIAQALYEPVFVAGLMRTLPRRLARHAGQDARVTAALDDNAERYGADCLGEIAWAAATDRIAPEGVVPLLGSVDGVPAIRSLAEILSVLHPGLSQANPPEEPELEPVGAEQ